MSANNQTLIKEHKGKWYVFKNVNAESWSWDEDKDKPTPNILHIKDAKGVFNSRDKAFSWAKIMDSRCGQFNEGTEYGVQFNRLYKDDAKVILIDE